jgi:uncharacterized protein YutE (UPF0331/DUF86 family)
MEEIRISIFLADFDLQVDQIEKIYDLLDSKHNSLLKKKVSPETVESSGYWLHNLYCAYEDLFKIVSAFWENNIHNDGAFHKTLVRRMLLAIEGVRPSLISEESYRNLDELRSFRHVFRHAYSYGLDDERVLHLLSRAIKDKEIVLSDIQGFREKVAAILAGVK